MISKEDVIEHLKKEFLIEEKHRQEKKNEEKTQFYALVNFFKLMCISKICKSNYDMFCLMGGDVNLDKLIQDIYEENICLRNYSLGYLYLNMLFIANTIEQEKENPLYLQAIDDFEHFCKVATLVVNNTTHEDSIDAAFDLINILPNEVVTPKVKDSLLLREKK